jgi:hypothetical protein
MLAQDLFQREDATAAVLPGAGQLADLRQRSRAVIDGGEDRVVGDDLAMADDH